MIFKILLTLMTCVLYWRNDKDCRNKCWTIIMWKKRKKISNDYSNKSKLLILKIEKWKKKKKKKKKKKWKECVNVEMKNENEESFKYLILEFRFFFVKTAWYENERLNVIFTWFNQAHEFDFSFYRFEWNFLHEWRVVHIIVVTSNESFSSQLQIL